MRPQQVPINNPVRPPWLVPSVCLALIAMSVAIYGQTLHHGFTNFDDQDYVTENSVVLRGVTMDGVRMAFTRYTCENWHPLTMISHMVDVQVFGLRAGAHHAVNLLLHALNSVLLFLFLRSLTGALWRSAVVAALFAVHPLHVESVAWIAERKDLLSGLFFLLTLSAYLRYVRRPFSRLRYLAVLLLFAAGLLCKPMLVTLPCLLLLLDWWPLGRWERWGIRSGGISPRLLLEKLPFVLLVLGDCVMTLRAQTDALSPLDKVPVVTRLSNALLSYGDYLTKTLCPRDLCVFYPLKGGEWDIPVLPVLGSLLLLLVLTGIAFSQRTKRPYLLLGWLWYLGMLVPVIGIVQVGAQSYADRYTYLPLIGVFLAGTWLVAEIFRGVKLRWKLLAASGVIVSLLCTSIHQVGYWRENEILWRHVLACIPEHPLPLNNLAEVLINQGRASEAVDLVRRASAFNPKDPRGHNNLGNVLLKSGDAEGALAEFREALRLDPSLVPVRQNLAKVLYQRGDRREGIQEMREALSMEPHAAPLANDLAWMLATAPERELRNGREAVALARDASGAFGNRNPTMLDTLAAAYAETGDFPKALETARQALRLVEGETGRGLERSGGEDKAMAATIRRELLLYGSGKPLRDPPEKN